MKFCLIEWAVYRLKVNGKRTKKENAHYRKSSALPVCFPFTAILRQLSWITVYALLFDKLCFLEYSRKTNQINQFLAKKVSSNGDMMKK